MPDEGGESFKVPSIEHVRRAHGLRLQPAQRLQRFSKANIKDEPGHAFYASETFMAQEHFEQARIQLNQNASPSEEAGCDPSRPDSAERFGITNLSAPRVIYPSTQGT